MLFVHTKFGLKNNNRAAIVQWHDRFAWNENLFAWHENFPLKTITLPYVLWHLSDRSLVYIEFFLPHEFELENYANGRNAKPNKEKAYTVLHNIHTHTQTEKLAHIENLKQDLHVELRILFFLRL